MIDGTGYGIGSHAWNPDPRAWVNDRFTWAFTTYGPAEPYNNGEHDLVVPEGYREDNRGAAITPDDNAWWVSLHTGLSSYNNSIARGNTSLIQHYTSVTGLPAAGLIDIAADPDGTLWIVDNTGRLLRFNPTTLAVQVWPGVSNVRRIVMDTTVVPRSLYVSMGNQGLAVIRAK
jgi:streptogramin lyase